MFGSIGIAEILVIAAVALVILGPDKFPGHAKIAMRFFRDIRGYWDEAKRDLTEELKPVKKEIKELEKYKPEDYLESMTMDQSEDTSYDGQGYPYGEDSSKKNGAEAEKPGEQNDTASGEPDPTTPSSEAGVEGTAPYAPDKDYVDESQRYPD
jgi:sec-independent protein translocase protein TatB